MSRVLLASDSADLRLRLAEATGASVPTIQAQPLPAAPAQLFQQLGAGAPIPEVIVLDTRADYAAALDLAGRLHAEIPGIAVVLVSDQPDSLGLAALRAGACDVVRPDADQAELGAVLERATGIARASAPVNGVDPTAPAGSDGRGQVISVVSPKGGVGKTTVAANLAVGLARTAPLSTVLVDLDVQFGDVASALNLAPEHALPDLVRGPAAQDSMVLKTFLTQHETGLYAVCGPLSPADADVVSPQDVTRLLTTLADEFRYIVVDTAPGLDDHTLAAIDQTDELIMMASLDVPGVRGLRKEIDIIRDLGLSFDGRHVVVNFSDAHSGLTKADVEATIGTGVDYVLPRTRGTAASVNQGVPLLQSDARDPMTKQLRRLVDRFTPAPMRLAEPTAPAPVKLGGRHRLRRKFTK